MFNDILAFAGKVCLFPRVGGKVVDLPGGGMGWLVLQVSLNRFHVTKSDCHLPAIFGINPKHGCRPAGKACAFSDQGPQADPVKIGRDSHTGYFTHRWEKVRKPGGGFDDTAGSLLERKPEKEWHPESTFIDASLIPAKARRTVKESRIDATDVETWLASSFASRAVVTCEQNHGFFQQFFIFKR